MKPILVMCPSRSRNLALQKMIDTIHQTSNLADIAVYVDEDQRAMYQDTEGAFMTYGPQIGPVASFNTLVDTFPGYQVYGAVTDDSEVVLDTGGWDHWVMDTANAFPNRIGVLGPCSPGSTRLDFPWATRGWIDVVGWLAYPKLYHWYWDIIIEVLADAAGVLKQAGRDDFMLYHDAMDLENPTAPSYQEGKTAVTSFFAFEYKDVMRRIRYAIKERVMA